jgi:hypothetical protein
MGNSWTWRWRSGRESFSATSKNPRRLLKDSDRIVGSRNPNSARCGGRSQCLKSIEIQTNRRMLKAQQASRHPRPPRRPPRRGRPRLCRTLCTASRPLAGGGFHRRPLHLPHPAPAHRTSGAGSSWLSLSRPSPPAVAGSALAGVWPERSGRPLPPHRPPSAHLSLRCRSSPRLRSNPPPLAPAA